MKKTVRVMMGIGAIWFVAIFMIFPEGCINSGIKGVFLCIDTVIPSLYPFFVCSGIITGLGLIKPLEKLMSPLMRPLFGVSGKGAMPFVMGCISGYPVGAVCVADLYSKGECSKSECEKMLAFCNNSGPLFILGVIGVGVFKNPQIGRIVYIIHIFSAIITGMIFKLFRTEGTNVCEISSGKRVGIAKVITDAFGNATANIISVCGYVIFFCVVGFALKVCGISPVFHGFLEISGGAEAISEMPIDFELKLLILSGMIAFSGLSVILQVVRIVRNANLSAKFYIWGKIIQGVISVILTFFVVKFMPVTQKTAVFEYDGGYGEWNISLGIIFIILILLLYINKKAVDN
ncbi:MAG: hypothetical protein E7415_00335 [Ruminococcaceae bacterium]|nr:hypothetical protein [Oscillospiraceae bacterium]